MGLINTKDPKWKTYSDAANHIDQPYYDTLVLAAGGTDFKMFQVPNGGTTPAATTKTLSDTNMVSAGQVPNGQNWLIRAIRAEYISAAAKATADIQTWIDWLSTVVVSLFVVGKDALFQSHLTEIIGMSTAFEVTPTAAGDNLLVMSTGRYTGVRPLNIAIGLEEQTAFDVRVFYPTALVAGSAIIGDSMRIYLETETLRMG